MKKGSSLALFLILSLFINAYGQTPKPTSTPQSDQDEVVRITTNLVQVDAVVTDKKGNLVTDLTADDFEIYEDGHPQKITNLSFIATAETQAPPARPSAATNKSAVAVPVPPTVRIEPEQVRRTIALVVDDLCLSWTSINYVRKALKKFVDEQIQPGDLVAIIRTAGGIGVLQQFTSDKRQLYAAVERVKWYPMGCNRIEAYDQLNQDLELPDGLSSPEDRNNKVDVDKDTSGINSRNTTGDLNGFRQDTLAVGTLGSLAYIVRGLKDLPGRKSVLFISDGFRLVDKDDSRRVLEAVDRVTDLASRSSVVVYTMDARGLPTVNFTASENVSGKDINGPTGGAGSFNKAASVMTARATLYNDTREGLAYLSRQTGGFLIQNTNDLAGGIKRVMDDQRGYYLIGYRPDESTFDPKTGRRKFHKFSVKVKRPGLTVRTRTGFYGVPEEAIVASNAVTRGQQLVKALISPFSSSEVTLRLTSLFGNDARKGSYMRSLLYIDASDLTFKEQPDGWYQTVMDVMAVTFGDNGQVVDEVNKTQTIRVRGTTYQNVLKHGLAYFMNVPVKKSGAYQLRIAVRDAATQRVGSASQFVEVPDLGKKQVALSGLVVTGYETKTAQAGTQTTPAASASAREAVSGAEGAQEEPDPQAGAAVRRFRYGMVMNYGYVIYNAQLNKSTQRPQLDTQLRLFRDGKLVFTGRVQPVDPNNQPDPTRLVAGGALRLGTDMPPGEYVLQVVVTDLLAKDQKRRISTQWIDFEIVK
ncbi:MAG TPA: VWA domain-containing protein [Pyrinomonadaceae bacterium]